MPERADATIHTASFELPYSTFASAEARASFANSYALTAGARSRAAPAPTSIRIEGDIELARAKFDAEVTLPLLRKQEARWPGLVIAESNVIDGVRVKIVTPAPGAPSHNSKRVLINVHGGAFMVGGAEAGLVESMPLVALGGFKVVSVDYRLWPEHSFPAANEDLATVYSKLLLEYEPQSIGIFGTSSGAMLAAQLVPWCLERDLPLPGALAMLAHAGQSCFEGDSACLDHYVYGGLPIRPPTDLRASPYFELADVEGPLVSPILWPEVLAKFPPSLSTTSTRAFEMSSVIDAHNKLTLAGARSHLHVWDGLTHGFHLDPDLPESREAEKILVDFFATYLG
jgi:monoterpene epsilon-lactone hydrolase